MNVARTQTLSTTLQVAVALAACAAMYGSMRQGAAPRPGGPAVAAITPADFPAMPPALRARILGQLAREADLGGSPGVRALARDCYAALAVQAGGAALAAAAPPASARPGD